MCSEKEKVTWFEKYMIWNWLVRGTWFTSLRVTSLSDLIRLIYLKRSDIVCRNYFSSGENHLDHLNQFESHHCLVCWTLHSCLDDTPSTHSQEPRQRFYQTAELIRPTDAGSAPLSNRISLMSSFSAMSPAANLRIESSEPFWANLRPSIHCLNSSSDCGVLTRPESFSLCLCSLSREEDRVSPGRASESSPRSSFSRAMDALL